LKLATRSYGWKYQNWFQFCTIRLAFNRGCLEVVLSKNTLCPLGVKLSPTYILRPPLKVTSKFHNFWWTTLSPLAIGPFTS
jgi:hypothetical protein